MWLSLMNRTIITMQSESLLGSLLGQQTVSLVRKKRMMLLFLLAVWTKYVVSSDSVERQTEFLFFICKLDKFIVLAFRFTSKTSD